MLSTRKRGNAAEEAARQHLEKNGLSLVEQNYHCRLGEIDLIMQDSDVLVFIEVRYRKSNHFGSPLATVDQKKQRKLIKSAHHYLQTKRLDIACRFDVVGISGKENHIQWIKNAFCVV